MQRVKEGLGAALAGAPTPLAAADRLCRACVELLHVDGASISLLDSGATQGTFGSSGPLSRVLDELQFTYGQGPCLDAVSQGRPVFADDLDGPAEDRWPALAEAILKHGIRAVYALPVTIAATPIGALDLYRHTSGPLGGEPLTGGLWAADLAALPLLQLMHADSALQAFRDDETAWEQLASLQRVEVYQATGALVAAFQVSAAEALVRLRAYAITHDMTASEVAYRVLDGRIIVTDDDLQPSAGDDQGRP